MKIIIIPARMGSKRFPGKPLHMIAGKPLLQWTYEQAKRTKADKVIVSGCPEVYRYSRDNLPDCEFIATSSKHENGTSRCSEVVQSLREEGHSITRIVNWQVDEPLVEPDFVNQLIADDGFGYDGHRWVIQTLMFDDMDCDYFDDPNAVKVVCNRDHRCLWFSRQCISPYIHVGVYSYSPEMLDMVSKLKPTRYTFHENNLEQLAWLDARFEMNAIRMNYDPLSINTPEDARKMEKFLQSKE